MTAQFKMLRLERKTERGNGTEGDKINQNDTHEAYRIGKTKRVALRTIPIVLKNGNKRMLVNCFLDDGSDTTYINEDVVEELGLQGQKEKITINVASGQQVSFDSMIFTIGLKSTDGNIDTTIEAKTLERICGGMKPVNRVKIQHQWIHLRAITFPELGSKSDTIGILTPSAEPLARNHNERLALKKVTESLMFDGEHYEIAVRWKGYRPNLINNRSQAKKRFYSTEQKLQGNNDVRKGYQKVIEEHLPKGYICR